jgi:hypothetical protein
MYTMLTSPVRTGVPRRAPSAALKSTVPGWISSEAPGRSGASTVWGVRP